MSPDEIKKAIARAGTSQAAIAEYLGKHVHSVNAVVNGHMRSTLIEAELEKIIGHPPFGPKKKGGRPKTVWTGEVDPAHAPSTKDDK